MRGKPRAKGVVRSGARQRAGPDSVRVAGLATAGQGRDQVMERDVCWSANG
jgi:hypothetical protein